MKKRWRPDSNIGRLSKDAYELACAMVESREPIYTAQDVIAEVARTFSEKINRNNVGELRRLLSEEAKEQDDKAMHRAVLAQKLGEKLGFDQGETDWLRTVISASVLANETDLRQVAPDKLARILIADRRADLLEAKLKQDSKKLVLELKRFQLEVDRLQRDLDREKAEREAKDIAARAAISDVEKLSKTDSDRLIVNTMKNALGITA